MRKGIVMTRDEFKRQLQELRDKVFLEALAYYELWQALWPSTEIVGTLNRYIGFFGPVRRALWEMMFIQLAKLFDRNPKAISLWQLLDVAKEDMSLVPHIAQEELDRMRDQLPAHENTLQALKQLRDQQLAHLDVNPSQYKPIPKGEFDRLIDDMKGLVLQLAWAHDQWGWDWSALPHRSIQDVNDVLQVLHKS